MALDQSAPRQFTTAYMVNNHRKNLEQTGFSYAFRKDIGLGFTVGRRARGLPDFVVWSQKYNRNFHRIFHAAAAHMDRTTCTTGHFCIKSPPGTPGVMLLGQPVDIQDPLLSGFLDQVTQFYEANPDYDKVPMGCARMVQLLVLSTTDLTDASNSNEVLPADDDLWRKFLCRTSRGQRIAMA